MFSLQVHLKIVPGIFATHTDRGSPLPPEASRLSVVAHPRQRPLARRARPGYRERPGSPSDMPFAPIFPFARSLLPSFAMDEDDGSLEAQSALPMPRLPQIPKAPLPAGTPYNFTTAPFCLASSLAHSPDRQGWQTEINGRIRTGRKASPSSIRSQEFSFLRAFVALASTESAGLKRAVAFS